MSEFVQQVFEDMQQSIGNKRQRSQAQSLLAAGSARRNQRARRAEE